MALVAVVLVAAVLLGWAARGRVRRLLRQPLAGGWLLVAGAAVLLAGGRVALAADLPVAYPVGSAGAAAAVAAFLLRNRRLPGVPLVALGLVLNAAVVGANGAMPVSAAAAVRAGVPVTVVATGHDPRHTLLGPSTRLAALADRWPLALPRYAEVVSAGDVLVAAGLGLLVVMAMTGAPRYDGSRRRGSPGYRATDVRRLRATTRASASTTRGSYSYAMPSRSRSSASARTTSSPGTGAATSS